MVMYHMVLTLKEGGLEEGLLRQVLHRFALQHRLVGQSADRRHQSLARRRTLANPLLLCIDVGHRLALAAVLALLCVTTLALLARQDAVGAELHFTPVSQWHAT